MKKFIRRFWIAAVLAFSSSIASAVVLDIDFNGDQFLLGTFDSAETGTAFYNYGSPWGASANPVYPGTTDPIPLQADALQIFSHVNTLTNELSFGVILEKPNGSGGGSFNADINFSAPAELAFLDDPGESGNSPLGTTGSVTIDLNWVNCCTDGFVISGFDPEDLFIDLLNVTGSDLDRVIFLSPDRNNIEYVFPDDVFSISINSCDPQTDPNQCVIPVSEPAPFALLAFGLLGIGLLRRRCVI